MISEEQLDIYRVEGILVRVVRDADQANDVRGFIVAWDDEVMVLRRRNRKVVKLSRNYTVLPASEPRPSMLD